MRGVQGVFVAALVAGVLASGAAAAGAASPQQQQFELAARAPVKLVVAKEGWYRVERRRLTAAGLPRSADLRRLQLYATGKQVRMRVTRGAVEFYGVPLDTLSTDRETYWLVAATEPGRRIAPPRASGSSGPTTRIVQATEVSRPKAGYYAAIRNGAASNLFGMPVRPDADTNETITLARVAAGAPASVEVALHGYSALAHRVRVRVNDTEVGTIVFTGSARVVNRFAVPANVLKDGKNVVTLRALGRELDFSLVDSVTLMYRRQLVADRDAIDFVLPAARRARVEGFSRRSVRIVDVTVPTAPVALRPTIAPSGTGFSATIGAARRTRHLLAFVDGKALRPAALVKNRPSSLHGSGGADLVIITHQRFASALPPLIAARQRAGLKVATVDVEDVYDEFAFGAHGPEGITAFLARVRTQWRPAPRFVLLVGDAGNDPRDYLGKGRVDFVPTKLVDTKYLETASDDSLADFNDDGAPELAVGRLPVRTLDQAR